MRVLISGATGMVGTGLLQELLQAGHSSLRASLHRTPPHLLDSRIEYVPADLTRLDDCLALARDCEGAVLAAAETGGAQLSREAPGRQLTANLVLNANLLEALARSRARRLILVSTASLYPESDVPWEEERLDLNVDPPTAFWGIGWVMRSLEKLAEFWHRETGIQVVVVRLANVYGPWARFDPATSNFIPALIRKAVAGLDPFTVWGSPAVERDVLYVSDAARALRLLLEQPAPPWSVVNLAAGRSVTVDETVRAVLRAAGHEPQQVVYQAGQPTTVSRRAYSIQRLQATIDWRPEVDLAEGLARTTAWWRQHQGTWTR